MKMDPHIQVSLKMEINGVMESYNMEMEHIMKEILLIMYWKEMALFMEKTTNMKERGKMEKCMVREKVNGITIKEKFHQNTLEST